MEFAEVIAKRRMTRRYTDQPVEESFLQRALANATRAPSAGFTQGWSFLVLRTPADLERFWRSTAPASKPAFNTWLDGMRTAPAVVVVLASEHAYRERYSEPDKAGAGLRAAEMPWWQIDAAMASLIVLQTATDAGLGACFFGIPASGVASMRDEFGVPTDFAPIGAITLGHPAAVGPSGSPARRRRKALAEVAHDGDWSRPFRP